MVASSYNGQGQPALKASGGCGGGLVVEGPLLHRHMSNKHWGNQTLQAVTTWGDLSNSDHDNSQLWNWSGPDVARHPTTSFPESAAIWGKPQFSMSQLKREYIRQRFIVWSTTDSTDDEDEQWQNSWHGLKFDSWDCAKKLLVTIRSSERKRRIHL